MRTASRLVLAGLGGLAAFACQDGLPQAAEPLQVYAASSLTEAFTDLEAAFEGAHEDMDVAVTFAGSQVLRLQIEQGAGADVFASANAEHVAALVEADLVSELRAFAGNELVVITPPDDSAGIERFEDLPNARRIVLGTPNVPVGAYARESLRRADALFGPGFSDSVLARVVSEESNVRLARAKVELGEADAAIVYLTDARASDRVRVVPIPAGANVRAEYRIALLAESDRPDAAMAWIDFVTSEQGREILARHGFRVEPDRP